MSYTLADPLKTNRGKNDHELVEYTGKRTLSRQNLKLFLVNTDLLVHILYIHVGEKQNLRNFPFVF